ncbi:MAG: hypothetical protein COX29_00635 [Candidatus Moranbacteria bacterium CG23_combo_of_CG06-09_8_20_14_all_35_22]|nr:MAG: hypothetical protein COX29_00635 [Candidatus Moranbacteria bacterium CG23_combo_of_CG06-09_8_20_14_all_35_22]
MNGFTKKTVQTLTLGEKLKKLRSDKRVSLSEVSRLTKIQPAYLEYLEEGCWEKLPADVYVKGFLRSYGEFLGVDENILIRLYEREKEIKENLNKNKKNNTEKRKPINISPFIFTPKKIAILIISALVVLSLSLLYREINSFASAPSLIIFNPQDNSQIAGDSVYIEGITDREALLFVNGQPVLVGDDGRFKENLTLQSGLNIINVRAINKFDKEAVENLNVNSNYEKKEENQKQEANENISNLDNKKEIQIEIKVEPGPVWISAEADGKLVFSGTMLSGAVQIFKAQEKIVLSSGNGKSTFITLNGQDLGALSPNSGAVKEAIFTPETEHLPEF